MTLITYPNLNQSVRASELPATILRVAVLKSNINTDARFKINGEVVGVDTNATIVIVKGVNTYQYQLTLQIYVPGTYSVRQFSNSNCYKRTNELLYSVHVKWKNN